MIYNPTMIFKDVHNWLIKRGLTATADILNNYRIEDANDTYSKGEFARIDKDQLKKFFSNIDSSGQLFKELEVNVTTFIKFKK